jgi:hypothetical protein
MNLSDTFYVALCMTVLILGVVYWFWTQNQFILRKLNMLENIVYEMKTSFQVAPDSEPIRADYAPAPSSVLGEDEDIEHEELLGEVEANAAAGSLPPMPEETSDETSVPDALQPGGIGSGVTNVVLPDSSAKGSVLDSMTLKELRRLAEQKGVAGAEKMRKQALIDAINAIPVVKPFEATEATLELS